MGLRSSPTQRTAALRRRSNQRDLLQWIERDEGLWERFFAQRSISPLRIIYEEFVESMEATLLMVMRFLRISLDERFQMEAPTLQKQADALSDAWTSRYRIADKLN